MQDIVGQAWPSACAEHGAVNCKWLPSECDWSSGRKKVPTHVYTN